MYDYNVNEIIDNIEMQRYCMMARYGIEPNKIILGRKIFSILEADFGEVKWTNAERYAELSKSGIAATVVGLPITVDCENIWTIEVCFELEENARNLASYNF